MGVVVVGLCVCVCVCVCVFTQYLNVQVSCYVYDIYVFMCLCMCMCMCLRKINVRIRRVLMCRCLCMCMCMCMCVCEKLMCGLGVDEAFFFHQFVHLLVAVTAEVDAFEFLVVFAEDHQIWVVVVYPLHLDVQPPFPHFVFLKPAPQVVEFVQLSACA